MQNLLKTKTLLLLALICMSTIGARAQSWKPAIDGITEENAPPGFANGIYVFFKTGGPLGRDWIYGRWLDSDSIPRFVGYREGGKWVSLPFTANYSVLSRTMDIVQYGDTMYIGGIFYNARIDGQAPPSNSTVSLLKYYNDSLWYDERVDNISSLAVSNDSLLLRAGAFYGPSDTFKGGDFFLATQGATHWERAFSPSHPTGTSNSFGTPRRALFHDNEILVLNNDRSSGCYHGVARWDGNQWQCFGQGLGSNVRDFLIFRGELYSDGYHDNNGNLVRGQHDLMHWDGQAWQGVGGGLRNGNRTLNLFTYKDRLYAFTKRDSFADVSIPHLAAWDGSKWCGTPLSFTGSPINAGVIDDTLYMVFRDFPSAVDGQPVSHINYFDGDYLNGPGSICSSSTLGVDGESAPDAALELYPVPALDEISISLEGEDIQRIKIYDYASRCILDISSTGMKQSHSLDIRALKPGIYLMQINGMYHRRFSKQN